MLTKEEIEKLEDEWDKQCHDLCLDVPGEEPAARRNRLKQLEYHTGYLHGLQKVLGIGIYAPSAEEG